MGPFLKPTGIPQKEWNASEAEASMLPWSQQGKILKSNRRECSNLWRAQGKSCMCMLLSSQDTEEMPKTWSSKGPFPSPTFQTACPREITCWPVVSEQSLPKLAEFAYLCSQLCHQWQDLWLIILTGWHEMVVFQSSNCRSHNRNPFKILSGMEVITPDFEYKDHTMAETGENSNEKIVAKPWLLRNHLASQVFTTHGCSYTPTINRKVRAGEGKGGGNEISKVRLWKR